MPHKTCAVVNNQTATPKPQTTCLTCIKHACLVVASFGVARELGKTLVDAPIAQIIAIARTNLVANFVKNAHIGTFSAKKHFFDIFFVTQRFFKGGGKQQIMVFVGIPSIF